MDSSFLTKKIGPLPFWAWAGILAVGLYLYRKSTASTSSTTSTGTASTGVSPPTETITTAGGTYSGPVNAAPSSITDPSTGVASTTTSTAPGTGATSPGNGGGTPGQAAATTTTVPTSIPNLFTIGGEQYQEIGTITGAGGQYFGNEVSGGAPVYFGNQAGVSQLSGPAAIEQQPVGTNAYVLASDAGNVSSTRGAAKF